MGGGRREAGRARPASIRRERGSGSESGRAGGPRPLTDRDLTLLADLERLVAPATRGDPERPLPWMSKSLDKLAAALTKMSHAISPGVGEVEWAMVMTVADMLLGMIWTDAANQRREQLFDRIARELDLGWEDRLSLSIGSNYGSLLALDWLIANLLHRLPVAIGILKSIRVEDLLSGHDHIDDDMAARLRTIWRRQPYRRSDEMHAHEWPSP